MKENEMIEKVLGCINDAACDAVICEGCSGESYYDILHGMVEIAMHLKIPWKDVLAQLEHAGFDDLKDRIKYLDEMYHSNFMSKAYTNPSYRS